jgi:thioredoxin 1
MANANVLTVTSSNFDQEVLKASVPVLLDFWAPWCGPCRMISPIVDELAAEKAGKAVIGKVNVDECQDLALKYRINAIPALLFFKGGEVVDQVKGNPGKAALAAKLDALAG